MAFIPNIPSSLGAISELDKAMTVAKHKGASVGGKSMWRSDEIDAWLAALLVSPQGRRCPGGDMNAAPQKRRESK